jgi:GNAT superfamily N-acetyltransferase
MANENVLFRLAEPADAPAVAALHADSWRRHYRGAYSDVFLDGDVHADRLSVWTDRLREHHANTRTILAERGALIGFAHIVFEEDPVWGALLDNLHVFHTEKRRGIGSKLLELVGEAVIERETGLYLWVLERNVDAQAFYQSRGAQRVERAATSPPGGIRARLKGSPAKLRYAWRDASVLVAGVRRS